MGVVYYLARPDNHTLFELGKWWRDPDVFFGGEVQADDGDEPRALLEEERLRSQIWQELAGERTGVDRDDYATELARRLTRFAEGRPVVHCSDAGDYFEGPEWHDLDLDLDDEGPDRRVIDTAYSEDWDLSPGAERR